MAARVPTARMDMELAAVLLFSERGADAVTVDDIAKAANVTARTFHRHFAHKLDVLFGDEEHQFDVMADRLRQQPVGLAPWAALCAAMEGTARDFDARRAIIRSRAAIVQADRALRQREQARVADFAAAMVAALHDRDVGETDATILAYAAIGVFRSAYEKWIADDDETFSSLVGTTAQSLSEFVSAD